MAELSVSPPCRVIYGERSAPVGATVYLALSALLENRGRLSMADLCREVWGRESVGLRTVWSLCHRANQKLSQIGCPCRCSADDGVIVLI